MDPPRPPCTPVLRPDVAESTPVAESRKRRRVVDLSELALQLEDEPEDFETAYRRLKDAII